MNPAPFVPASCAGLKADRLAQRARAVRPSRAGRSKVRSPLRSLSCRRLADSGGLSTIEQKLSHARRRANKDQGIAATAGGAR